MLEFLSELQICMPFVEKKCVSVEKGVRGDLIVYLRDVIV